MILTPSSFRATWSSPYS